MTKTYATLLLYTGNNVEAIQLTPGNRFALTPAHTGFQLELRDAEPTTVVIKYEDISEKNSSELWGLYRELIKEIESRYEEMDGHYCED